MLADHNGEFVFPGGKAKKPLSNAGMSAVLDRMGRDDITVHGFRSTFRDWAAEMTNFPNEVVEMALAHVIENKVEAAYRRGDLFEKRRPLMEAWAEYCAKPASATGDKVVPIGRGEARVNDYAAYRAAGQAVAGLSRGIPFECACRRRHRDHLAGDGNRRSHHRRGRVAGWHCRSERVQIRSSAAVSPRNVRFMSGSTMARSKTWRSRRCCSGDLLRPTKPT